MSDERRRQLERATASGDNDARAALARHLERAQDQPGLCSIGEHAYGDPEEWISFFKDQTPGCSEIQPGTIFRLHGLDESSLTDCRVTCSACGAHEPVQWVRHLFGAGLSYYLQQLQLAKFYDRGLGVAHANADGTIELIDPDMVAIDRGSPLGIAVEASSQGDIVEIRLPAPGAGHMDGPLYVGRAST